MDGINNGPDIRLSTGCLAKRVTVDVLRNDDGHIKTQYIVALPIILLKMDTAIVALL